MFPENRWERRRVERRLAQQLHEAHEHVRISNQSLRGATSGADLPSLEQIKRPLSQGEEAAAYAQGRWLSFVNERTIPDDLASDQAA